MTYELDEDTLLTAASNAGWPVTSDQLKRWRRAGLVQRPRQEYIGGRRGSVSWYPVEAREQLISVARRHGVTHRLSHLLLGLWWDDEWVDRAVLRETLLKWFDRLSSEARTVLDGRVDLFDAVDELVGKASLRNLSPPLSLMVRRLPRGTRDLREVLWLVGVFGLGGDYEPAAGDDGAPSSAALLARATGADRARADRPLGNDPWLPPNVSAMDVVRKLREAGAELADMGRLVREASDAELDRARDDAEAFERLAAIGRGMQGVIGEDVAGVASLTVLAAEGATGRMTMIWIMLAMRRAAGDEPLEQVRALVDENHARFAAIAALKEALPQHADLMGPGFEQRLASLSRSQAAAVRADLLDYLSKHADVAAALEVLDV
jgi:hypothetical protein